jgi:hypothetical protein
MLDFNMANPVTASAPAKMRLRSGAERWGASLAPNQAAVACAGAIHTLCPNVQGIFWRCRQITCDECHTLVKNLSPLALGVQPFRWAAAGPHWISDA